MCIAFFLQVDQAFTASVESKVTPLTIAVFLKFSSGNSGFFSNFYFTKGESKITMYLVLQSSYAINKIYNKVFVDTTNIILIGVFQIR